ncbi:MAG: N-acetyltransferase family protein [Halobacteriaceae archaeon]
MTYEIIDATQDDLDRIADLWVQLVASQREYGAHLLAEENRSTARDLLGQYIVSDDLLVAKEDDRIYGFVMVHTERGWFKQDGSRGIIDNIFVIQEKRGEGIGTALLENAEMRLREADVD